MEPYIILGVTLVICLLAFLIFRGERKKYFKLTLKVLAIIYIVIAFFRFMLSDSFIWVINKGVYSGHYYESTDVLQSILRWGHHVSYVVVVMACFFDSRLLKNISVYFCLPFAILNTVFFSDFMSYFMGEIFEGLGRGIQTSYTFRA